MEGATVTTTTTETPATKNGVNVAHLLGARQALTDTPEAAKFQWRVNCDWITGTHSRTTMLSYFGLGQEHAHRQTFAIDADHPEVFASQDNGATPTEIAMAALVSCLTAGVATVATNRGIELRRVSATAEGDMDLQGVLGIDGDVRNGFDHIRVTFDIDADATKAELEAIVAQSQKRSAVFDMIANPTAIEVKVS
jgi:uncharacterized OsmC-like protein